MNSKNKILMVMPSLPYPESGAEQSDRAWGIRLLKELGYEVKVLAKWPKFKSTDLIETARKEFGVEIITVPYVFSSTQINLLKKIKKYLYQISHLIFLDGAALEYAEPVIVKEFKDILDDWQPDIVWFEYTYLWPLYALAKDRKLRIITRSLNFEPDHFWQEDGPSFLHRIVYWAKLRSEKMVIKNSDYILAITPNEACRYSELGAKHVGVLPLRGLSSLIGQNLKKAENRVGPYQVFFLGSTYNVSHNRQALEFLLREIIPFGNQIHPGEFVFNIFGAKVPAELLPNLPGNVIIRGYVPDLSSALTEMDLAVTPSLLGAGMQQKIFEPLVRGIPTVASARGLAGYPFVAGEHLLTADTAKDFATALGRLAKDFKQRQDLAEAAVLLSKKLFAKEAIISIINESLTKEV
ncbi:MAG: glycosyltransferase [Candidatus Paceibacterota bacterium]|jgi:glycosyltransferase involved in cell wall biosynthesis